MCGARVFSGVGGQNTDRTYTFVKGPGGEIKEVRCNNTTVISYTYDDYGKATASFFVSDYDGDKDILQNVAWKCHVYDPETGFYYVNAEYYDPETGRFICHSLESVTNGMDLPGGVN